MTEIDNKRKLISLDGWHAGNQFFMYEYPTIKLENQIKSMDTFEEFDRFFTNELMDGNVLLKEYLSELLEHYNANAEAVSVNIGYSHDYVRKIAVGDRKNPGRDVLLAICAYIHATVEETQALLRYAGHQPLYARRRRDAIIWFALEKGQSFNDLNAFLVAQNYRPLDKD